MDDMYLFMISERMTDTDKNYTREQVMQLIKEKVDFFFFFLRAKLLVSYNFFCSFNFKCASTSYIKELLCYITDLLCTYIFYF